VLLLDEPLSALDKKLREHTQFELMRLQRQLGITFVMVTHDQDEAMAMSTRIAILDQGKVVEVGAPRQIYERPGSRFVADFIGGANILDAEPAGPGQVRIPALGVTCAGVLEVPGWVALRPERIALGSIQAVGGPWPTGVIEAVAFHGDTQLYRIKLASGAELRAAGACTAGVGDTVCLSWAVDAPVVLTR
jgi:putrescine transport system ATP-binding protein